MARDAQNLLSKNQVALVRYLRNASTVLDALYDNRVATFNGAMATNRAVAAKFRTVIKNVPGTNPAGTEGGFVDTTAKIRPATTPAPDYYTAGDCSYCGIDGLGRAGVSSMLSGGGR